MSLLEWLAIGVAAITGLGSGALSALFSPFAQRRAEETKLRQSERRKLISDGRALIAEATHWEKARVANDPRFLAVRRHLSEKTLDDIQSPTLTIAIGSGIGVGNLGHLVKLRDDLERLEAEWKLT